MMNKKKVMSKKKDYIGQKHKRKYVQPGVCPGLLLLMLLLAFSGAGCASRSTGGSQTLVSEDTGIKTGTEETGAERAGAETDTQAVKEEKAGQGEMEPVSRDIFAMDTYMTLTAYGEGADEALDAAVSEIERIENLVSTGIDSSEIAVINKNGSGPVSKDTEYLIERSEELYEDMEGVFDITIYPVMEAWGFTSGEYRIPGEDELKNLLSNMGADQINCQEGAASVGKPGMKIDLGGIAKGYTSGRVMDIFREYGVDHAVISLGGNVQVRGDKPDGSSWRVAIENPENTAEYIGIVEVQDKAVITSGGYERYFEENGEVYHHIIDPSTGYPAKSGLISVSIVSADGTLADGLSTSLFIMGKEEALDYWREHAGEFDAILVEEDGTVSVTEGIADSFSGDREWKTVHK